MNNKAMLDEMKEKIKIVFGDYLKAINEIRANEYAYTEDEIYHKSYAILEALNQVTNQILSVETKDCRIAVVKKEGELPEVPLWAIHDGSEIRGADIVYKLALADVLKDNWVQEVKLSE